MDNLTGPAPNFTPTNKPARQLSDNTSTGRDSIAQDALQEHPVPNDEASPKKEKKKRRQYAASLKGKTFRKDKMPAYLKPDELSIYLPEDLSFDTLWPVIGTFTKAFIAQTITSLCGTEIDQNNISTREHAVCEERAKARAGSVSRYKQDTKSERTSASTEAAKEAEASAAALMEDDDFHLLRAVHQTLAALLVAYSHSPTSSTAPQEATSFIKKVALQDGYHWDQQRLCNYMVDAARAPATYSEEELLQRALNLIAEWAENDGRRTAFVLRTFYPYISKLADEDVKRRVDTITKCLTDYGVESVDDLDCWGVEEGESSVDEAAMSERKLATKLRADVELTSIEDALTTLHLLRDTH